MTFKKGSIENSKPDKKGRVMIKIFLIDEEKKAGVFPVNGNRKEEIVLEGTTVGEVINEMNALMFSEPTQED